jgi:hypothetical protein
MVSSFSKVMFLLNNAVELYSSIRDEGVKSSVFYFTAIMSKTAKN